MPVNQWEAYRELRLRALKEDPEAYSSSYADSLSQPEEYWKRRLAEALDGERSWLLFAKQEDRLVGMIGAFIDGNSPDLAIVVSVYVPREARGRRISVRLMEAMLRVLSDVPGLKRARLSVNVTQLAAIQLYKGFGFFQIGMEPATTGAGQAVQQSIMERTLPFREPK